MLRCIQDLHSLTRETELVPPRVDAQSSNHWEAREFLELCFYCLCFTWRRDNHYPLHCTASLICWWERDLYYLGASQITSLYTYIIPHHYYMCLCVCMCVYPHLGFPGGSESKESACNVRDLGLILASGRSPGKGNGNPLQFSYLENSVNRETWQVTVHGVAKSETRLSLPLLFTYAHLYHKHLK